MSGVLFFVLFTCLLGDAIAVTCSSDGSDVTTNPACDPANPTACTGTCTDDGTGTEYCCPASSSTTCSDGSAISSNPACDPSDPTACTGTCTDDGTGSVYCCPADVTTTTTGAMTTTKAATTAAVVDCRDKISNCATYKDLCKNPSYQYMLAQNCPVSCKFCKPPGCLDAKTECADWNTKGFCTSTAYTDATKKAYCAKTCGKC